MYLWTRENRFAARALEIGTHILQSSVETPMGIAWKDTTRGEVLPGFAYGASGIALFLLHLGVVTQDGEYLTAARKALDHEIGSARVEFPDGLPRWQTSAKRNLWSPYWMYGGCGIGSVFIRFYRALNEQRYLELARDIARANYSRFCVLPGQFEGLSGIGELMLDMSVLSGAEEFDAKARHVVESVLLYEIAKRRATAFPGRFLVRLSTDYGYGSAGVGIFLNRFLKRKERLLHDLRAP
jgi:lantibiotic modifying enzyme